MYPLKMKPQIKEIIWGGNKMKEMFGKVYSFEKAGESWEVSTNDAGKSVIANGKLKGMTFSEAIAEFPEIAGSALSDFPLMFKIIDANSDLSIQVHPNDEYAKTNENGSNGKTEMWYILHAEPDAKIGYGFNKDMTDDEIRAAIDNGDLEKYIRYINVKQGETYFIPAGTVHCLCSGLVVAELQQNSNVTYRLYDYNRTDKNGNKRELHIEKALDVISKDNTEPKAVLDEGLQQQNLVYCNYFVCDVVSPEKEYTDCTVEGCHLLFFKDGSGKISYVGGSEKFKRGDTFIIPKSLGEYKICGKCSYLKCYE